mmetsp:Transcript_18755/g.52166  ORF Transcript_18755/g.52166 Transcript_18755/m.52166 type:complete len:222 (-) Transcript_18755:294-959(-)
MFCVWMGALRAMLFVPVVAITNTVAAAGVCCHVLVVTCAHTERMMRLGDLWQLESVAPGLGLDVVVEEVGIQKRLEDAAEVDHPVVLVSLFRVRSVDPIEDVERSVGSHEEDVVSREVLHLLVALQNDELREDGDGLEVDAEHPQQFDGIEALHALGDHVGGEGDDGAWGDGESPMQKGILRLVVGRFDGLLVLDGVDDGRRGADVDDLHDGVVDGVESEE